MKYVEPTAPVASNSELLSALHDGQLDATSAAALVKASLTDGSLMQEWRSICAISAALDTAPAFGAAVSSDPIQTVRHREPSVAANDSVFRWKIIAGIATLAAFGSILWGVVGSNAANPDGAVLAQQTPPASTSPVPQNIITVSGQALQSATSSQTQPVMIRDPRLDELLAAHKQFGGHSALQQPAGSLRSVSLVSSRP